MTYITAKEAIKRAVQIRAAKQKTGQSQPDHWVKMTSREQLEMNWRLRNGLTAAVEEILDEDGWEAAESWLKDTVSPEEWEQVRRHTCRVSERAD